MRRTLHWSSDLRRGSLPTLKHSGTHHLKACSDLASLQHLQELHVIVNTLPASQHLPSSAKRCCLAFCSATNEPRPGSTEFVLPDSSVLRRSGSIFLVARASIEGAAAREVATCCAGSGQDLKH